MSTPSWLGNHGFQPVLNGPKARWPNYPALIEVLLNLHRPLDPESGETILTSEEAATISACGFEARAGLWRCPLLQDDLVSSNPFLYMLSDRFGPECRGNRWHPRRASVRPFIAPMDALNKFDRRLIRLLQKASGQGLERSALKRTLWRSTARFVEFTIDRLLAADYITDHEGFLYPFSRASFKVWREAQSRPRRPVPISTFP